MTENKFGKPSGPLAGRLNANDDSHSIFVLYGEHDFSAATAKDTDFGALGFKATLIGGYVSVTQVKDGTNATDTIKISSAVTGGTPLASTITITKTDTVYSNVVGNCLGIAPLAAGTDVAATAHIYAYTAADGTRSTGKARIALFFQKSA